LLVCGISFEAYFWRGFSAWRNNSGVVKGKLFVHMFADLMTISCGRFGHSSVDVGSYQVSVSAWHGVTDALCQSTLALSASAVSVTHDRRSGGVLVNEPAHPPLNDRPAALVMLAVGHCSARMNHGQPCKLHFIERKQIKRACKSTETIKRTTGIGLVHAVQHRYSLTNSILPSIGRYPIPCSISLTLTSMRTCVHNVPSSWCI